MCLNNIYTHACEHESSIIRGKKKTFVNLKRVCERVALRLKTIIPFMNKKRGKISNPGSRLVARIVKQLNGIA